MAQDQEQEIQRDRSWITVQKKTFTRWSNNFLKDRRMHIDDLQHDLSDGLKLINLLEIISSKEVGKYNKNPKIGPQKLENNSLALTFIKNQSIKLVAIGPEDIVDGNLKLILGLIWTLILRFQIQRGGFEGKAELLEWVRKQVAPYGEKPNNFNLDWTNGRVLAALTDSLKPGTFPQDTWTGDALRDIGTSIDTAHNEYEIPKLLDPEDIHECPDELAMMTYISYFRDWWLDQAKRREAELEAERLRKLRTADPSQCYATGPGLTAGTTNNEAPFTIQAVNYFGDPLPTGGDVFVVTLQGPNGPVQVNLKDNNNGTHSAAYVPRDVGQYNLGITLRDQNIKDAPFRPVIRGADARTSSASGPGVEGARINKPAPFVVQSRDANGQNVPTGNDPFAVNVRDPTGKPLLVQFNDTKNGTYEGVYTPVLPGRYTVDVTLNGQPIKNSPYTPLMEQGNAARSWAEGEGLTQGQTRRPATFRIHSVDADGNPVKTGGDPFTVNISGPENVTPRVTDNHDGTYDVLYQVELPGTYTIEVNLHGEPIKDAPFHPKIKWSCDANQSYVTGDGVTPGAVVDNKPTQFTIHAVDHEGKPRSDGGDPFVVAINGPAGPIPANVSDNNDGTYLVQYFAEVQGPIVIEVTLEGANLRDTPVHLDVLPGVDIGSTDYKEFQFTVQARDRHGQPIPFGGAPFVVTPNNHAASVTTRDNQDGTYTASIQLPQKGQYSFNVSLNNQVIARSPVNISY